MSGKFITNINTHLSEYISNTLPDTEKFQALVGYFYFSGFAELYQGLQDKKVEILVGMNTDMITLRTHDRRQSNYRSDTHPGGMG